MQNTRSAATDLSTNGNKDHRRTLSRFYSPPQFAIHSSKGTVSHPPQQHPTGARCDSRHRRDRTRDPRPARACETRAFLPRSLAYLKRVRNVEHATKPDSPNMPPAKRMSAVRTHPNTASRILRPRRLWRDKLARKPCVDARAINPPKTLITVNTRSSVLITYLTPITPCQHHNATSDKDAREK